MTNIIGRLARTALVGLLVIAAGGAAAQAYPSKPVRVVIPLGSGGTTDVPGRIVAQRLSESLGQQFVVENKTGAGGTIGADFVAKSKPDGYTLLLTATPHVIAPNLYKNLPYNALTDFAPVIRVASGPYVLTVHPSLGVNSVRELIALAKKQPGKIDYASSGNGGTQHLVGALFAHMAGIELTHVPYKSSSQAQQDLIAGMVKVGFPGTPIAIPHMKSGRLKALAVTTAQRSPHMPEVPTIAESGVPGYEAMVWVGLLAPSGTPPDIIAKLNGEIAKLLRAPDVQQLLASSGMDPSPTTPEEFGAYLKSEYEKWGKVVRDSGATVN
jgi:tripartite-type tricarboxylate transporter receptor subunit TctC